MSENENTETGGSWSAIFLIYAICVLGATSISQAVPVIGDISRYFHVPREHAGWIISMPSALVALGAVFVGWIVDKVGDKPVMLWGCLLLILGDIGVTMVDSMNPLLLMRAIEGVGYVCVAVATVTMMTRVAKGKRRNLALALWSSFVPMSFAVPLVLAKQLAGTDRWQWAFLGHAIALAIAALLALKLPAAVRRGEGKGEAMSRTAGLATVLRMPAPYALGLAFACGAFVQTGIVSTLPHLFSGHLLHGRFEVAFPIASSMGTIGMLSNIAGCLLMGPLLNRGASPLGVAVVGAVLALLGGIGLYVPGVSFGLAVFLVNVFFFGAGLIVGLWALLPAMSPNPSSRGAISGLVTQVTLFGVLLGPPLAFAALGSGDWMRQITNISVALVACVFLVLYVTRSMGLKTMRNAGGGH